MADELLLETAHHILPIQLPFANLTSVLTVIFLALVKSGKLLCNAHGGEQYQPSESVLKGKSTVHQSAST
jgi:hypothetical protein